MRPAAVVVVSAIFALLSSVSGVAEAGCSGSGTTWTCTAGTSSQEVQTALNAAADSATLTFQAGTYSSWTSTINFPMNKGATVLCASKGVCTITSPNIIGMPGTCSGTSDKLYRVSGFTFSGGNNPRFWFYGGGPCRLNKVRIDNNTFSNIDSDGTIIYFGENSAQDNYFQGVVDHNIASSSQSFYLSRLINGSNTPPSGSLGTGDNMFFEDNKVTVTSMTSEGGAVDGWGGHGVVWRYNSSTNARVLMHGVQHQWGPRNFEAYGNTVTHTSGSRLADGYRSFHHQGSGTSIFFNNTINPYAGKSNEAIAMLHYRSWTSGLAPRCDGTMSVDANRSPSTTHYGYPCKRQPGRDVNGALVPVYAWNNRFGDGTKADLNCSELSTNNPYTCIHHFKRDRDYYSSLSANPQTSPTSPFNGTTGVGFGTLANRPTSCSTNGAESGGGVGYFATDVGAQGTLYRCSATNTWTVHYVPFKYPHPLVQDGGIEKLAAPLNLRIF
jgi:hypothetical protein